jgi:hypothetical protein
MKNLVTKIFFTFSIFLISMGSIAQGKESQEGNQAMLIGSQHLLNGQYAEAERFFRQASKEFKKIGDTAKVNDCYMGLATLEFLRGNYQKSYDQFLELKMDHIKNKVRDLDGLKLIEQNILACEEKLKNKKGK